MPSTFIANSAQNLDRHKTVSVTIPRFVPMGSVFVFHGATALLEYVIADTETMPDEDLAWFWSSEWQAGEAEADRDLVSGNFVEFDTVDDFLASL